MMRSYAELSEHLGPDPLAVRMMKFVEQHETALDIGAGSLRNTKFLLEKGFRVTAIDTDPALAKYAKEVEGDLLTTSVCDVANFNFSSTYDIILAVNTLSFLAPPDFYTVLEKIKNNLSDEGVLCVTLFGNEDEWSGNEEMTFLSRSEAEECVRDLHTLVFIEEKSEGATIEGEAKFWHIFRIIAQKKRAGLQ